MNNTEKPSSTQRLKKLVIGEARSLSDPSLFHKMSLIAFFAWVGLGADGISSSCYGPEEAFRTFGSHIYLSIFVAIGSVLTIFIISASYNQIIDLFPTGGGGYLVASKLLSPSLGMISGCALMIDYLLTITISIASGTDALFSFLPAEWLHYKLMVAVAGVIILTWLNMRGVKESVMPLVPIFLCFILTHAFAIIYGIFSHMGNLPEVAQATVADIRSTTSEVGIFGMIFLILRSYSMGAGTYTGIEAVSNGIPILREPKALTARRTMQYMAYSLAFMVSGLMIAYILYNVGHVQGKTLNAVLFEQITKTWNSNIAYTFVLVTLFSEATLLFVAAQTGFLGGPRVLSNMAMDRWVPTRFSSLNDRLVSQDGILIMGISAVILMWFSKGDVRFLVVLYSIDVFITFLLSQLGMVKHWWQSRNSIGHWKKKFSINGLGLVLTIFILLSMIILKFHEGGWITILITGALVAVSLIIKRHYGKTFKLLNRLESLVQVTKQEIDKNHKKLKPAAASGGNVDPNAKTAVLFVNGFSGTGLHTLFSIIRFFGGIYKNFVFVQIGLIDSGVFKGADEINDLKTNIETDAEKYVQYMRQNGYYAECITSVAIDVVEESTKIAPKILERFPQSVFFTGQLVFPEDSLLTRWLHNYTSFAIQRRFYHLGLPIVILPIRV